MSQVTGDPDAERPWLLVNPDDPSKGHWDGLPEWIEGTGHPRLVDEWSSSKAPQLYEQGVIQNETGMLVAVESRRGLKTVAEYFSHRAWMPTIVIVDGHEPQAVLDAYERGPAPSTGPGRTARHRPFEPDQLGFLQAVIDAEESRGNSALYIEDGLPHSAHSWATFLYAIDAEAILAEFDLGATIEIEYRREPWLTFWSPGRDKWSSWSVGGARLFTSDAARAAREQWWTEWRRAPRPKTRLVNPLWPETGLPETD